MKLSTLLILLSLCCISLSQEDISFESPYTDFSVDPLGNLYTITDQSLLTKMVENNEFDVESYDYSNRSLGEITNFDTTNPLKVIVNHQDFSTLVLLDVTLRETARIYLPDLQIFSNPVAYCMATDNTVWLFDDVNATLVRINEEGQKIFETQNLIQEVGYVPEISNLRSSKNYLVAYDALKGFLVFDQYGAFLKTIPIKNLSDFQLIDDKLYYSIEEKIYGIPIKVSQQKEVAELPEKTDKFFLFQDTIFFLNFLGVGEMRIVPLKEQ